MQRSLRSIFALLLFSFLVLLSFFLLSSFFWGGGVGKWDAGAGERENDVVVSVWKSASPCELIRVPSVSVHVVMAF